ncbi:hypothetical protein IT407_04030 [Candidatus Uhrbacteria bacterium]|nr:hypothetical protein [Candidatus Uhrbacteria bacterium]
MPPRDTTAEITHPAEEVILQSSPEKGLELIEKAVDSKGITGVIEIAKQEADDAISGIHKLGTFDPSENYPGSAEEVMKMKSANEGAAKQVQEAVHALELDLSEFGEAPAKIETPVEAKIPAPVVEAPKPAEPPAAEAPIVVDKATEEAFEAIIQTPKKTELEEALAETHELIGKQSGLKVEGEKLVEKSDSEKFDDQIESEEQRLKAYEQEALQEKKTLDEFTGGHNIGMTDLEKGYANSLTAHIAHLEASAVLTELMVQKLRMQKGNNSEGVKRIQTEIDLAEAEVERTHTEAERITKEYETMLQGIMNQPLDKSAEETAQPEVKIPEAAKQAVSISPSNFPLPKDAGFAYAPAAKKQPGAISKIWGKVWKSMKFWEV